MIASLHHKLIGRRKAIHIKIEKMIVLNVNSMYSLAPLKFCINILFAVQSGATIYAQIVIADVISVHFTLTHNAIKKMER